LIPKLGTLTGVVFDIVLSGIKCNNRSIVPLITKGYFMGWKIAPRIEKEDEDE
jgi:hypothetical protein